MTAPANMNASELVRRGLPERQPVHDDEREDAEGEPEERSHEDAHGAHEWKPAPANIVCCAAAAH